MDQNASAASEGWKEIEYGATLALRKEYPCGSVAQITQTPDIAAKDSVFTDIVVDIRGDADVWSMELEGADGVQRAQGEADRLIAART